MSPPTGRVLVLAGLLLATSGYLASVTVAESPPARAPLAQLPLVLDDWTGRDEPELSSRVMKELGVDDYLMRTYWRRAELPLGLYVGYYRSQRQGDTMHSPLNCLPGSGWTPLHTSQLVVSTGQNTSIEVRRVTIQKGLDRQLVLYWYQSHGRVIASEYWGKIYTVVDAIATHRTDAALVRVITPLSDGSADAERAGEQRAAAFVRTFFGRLSAHIPD